MPVSKLTASKLTTFFVNLDESATTERHTVSPRPPGLAISCRLSHSKGTRVNVESTYLGNFCLSSAGRSKASAGAFKVPATPTVTVPWSPSPPAATSRVPMIGSAASFSRPR